MINQILNEAVPYVTAALVGIIIVIVKNVGDALINVADAKSKELTQKYQLDKYTDTMNKAKDVWKIVEEHFRITDSVTEFSESKVEMFNRLLLKKVPGLTQEQINSVRQAIAGEFNKGKQVVLNDKVLADTNLKLKEEKAKVTDERDAYKARLEQLQSILNQNGQV